MVKTEGGYFIDVTFPIPRTILIKIFAIRPEVIIWHNLREIQRSDIDSVTINNKQLYLVHGHK